jgi:predicted amidohydrolase
MSRKLIVASAQMGGIQRGDKREATVARLVALLEGAAAKGAQLVVFPEATLTPFFPHWLVEDDAELESYFEREMPNPSVAPLFDRAQQLGVGFYLGYAELAASGQRFNTAVLVGADGKVIGKYRKLHLPGYREPKPGDPFQNLEKRYFEPGDLGFPVWEAFGGRVGMCLCNDRRWPETYRVMGLQGVELVLLGYNTPLHYPAMQQYDHLQAFHNQISMQANAYANGTWVVGTAKAGEEEGIVQLGQSVIISPTGEVVAMASTTGDESIVAEIDLDECLVLKKYMFNFRAHRRPEHYQLIAAPVEQTWSVGTIE